MKKQSGRYYHHAQNRAAAKKFVEDASPEIRGEDKKKVTDSASLLTWVRTTYAQAIYKDPAATLDDLHEAVNTLEDTKRTARRVLGGANPVTGSIEQNLEKARSTLAAFNAR